MAFPEPYEAITGTCSSAWVTVGRSLTFFQARITLPSRAAWACPPNSASLLWERLESWAGEVPAQESTGNSPVGVWLPAGMKEEKTSWASSLFYLFQPPPLLLLLLDPFLPLRQQLPFILLLLPELLLLQELLSPKGLRALLVLLLQSQEIPAKGGLAGHVDDGAVGGSSAVRGMLWAAMAAPHAAPFPHSFPQWVPPTRNSTKKPMETTISPSNSICLLPSVSWIS